MSLISFTCSKCGGSSYEQFTQTQVRCMHCGSISIFDTGYKPKQEFQLSNDTNLLDFEKKIQYVPASLGKRLINYIVDIFFVVFIIQLVITGTEMAKGVAEINDFDGFIFLAAYICYFALMEYKFGKTLGKMISKTKVVSTDGTDLGLGQLFWQNLMQNASV